MLSKISLKNFKCFDHLNMPCKPITLLCGLNGMGKSSVMQALLLLRQSFQSGTWGQTNQSLILGGNLADLGTGKDVLCENSDEEIIEIELQSTDTKDICQLKFNCSSLDDDQLKLVSSSKFHKSEYWRLNPPFGGKLAYIGADRIVPQKLYRSSSEFPHLSELGFQCELTFNYLYSNRFSLLDESDPRCIDGERKLLQIVEYWLQKVSPGSRLEIRPVRSADSLIGSFKFEQSGDVVTQPYRPTNVGFGLSYVLPVIVSLMLSKGTLCLIENPEAHLHPRGQTELAELAVLSAKAGVQILVETHSDHFLDGIRIAVRDGLIDADETAIHYFSRTEASVLSSPIIDSDGRLSFWPDGFFDQQNLNLMRLIEPKA